MPVRSMTGFARVEAGDAGGVVWELRSVNGKGLDLRFRLPQGFEAAEPELRRLAASRLSRGNVQVALVLREAGPATGLAINEAALRLYRQRFAAGAGSYPLVGTPERIVGELARIRAAGFAGVALSFVNYRDELPYFCETVVPAVRAWDAGAGARAALA